jgi:ribosome-binding factor A
MPEHRARKHHQDRVAETLREEIGAMIEGELSDPRIAFCYVTEVESRWQICSGLRRR